MSTRYVLSEPYRLRGWYKLPMGLYSTVDRKAIFASKEDYLLLLKCDGAHDLTADTMSEAERATLEELLANEVVRPALPGEFLKPEQAYKSYPARYRESVHWSITGACNLKCRHCFMSAPNAKHGSPTHEQLMDVVEQLAECGVCSVGITGGEPLVRKDFLDIVDALVEREIADLGREQGYDLVGTAQDDGQVLVCLECGAHAFEHDVGGVVAAERIDGNDDCLCHGLLLNKRQTPAAVKAYGGLFDCKQNEFIRSR